MPMQFDLGNMSPEEFDAFMREALDRFKETVQTSEDYQFARDGDRMALGDWFEQFACGEDLM